jgi:hypothetical protein
MDEKVRELERSYLSDQSTDTLIQLMIEYARVMSIPDADIAILLLVNKGATYKPVGRKSGWNAPLPSHTQVRALYDFGYDAGVYFTVKNPSVSAVDNFFLMLRDANTNNVHQLGFMDSISGPQNLWTDIGPGNRHARTVLEDGREVWEHNLQIVRNAMRFDDGGPSSPEIYQLLSDYYRDIYRGKKNTHYGRFFIPAWVLEYCYCVEVTNYRQGFSASTVRNRATSTIDWSSSSRSACLRRELYGNIGPEIGQSPKDFGYNLLLKIDTASPQSARRIPLSGIQVM